MNKLCYLGYFLSFLQLYLFLSDISMKLSLCFLIALLMCAPAFSYPTFAQYCQQFHKSYNDQEKIFREGVYNQKIEGFANITSYVPGVNNFTDWTEEQFKGLLSLQTVPEQQRVSSGTLVASRLGAPVSVDWRDSGIVTSIKDQGNCGACWAFTAVAVMESYLLQKGKQSNGIDLSEQSLVQCTSDSDCSGGYIQYGLDSIKNGAPTQSQYPYAQLNGYYGGNICSTRTIDTGASRKSYYSLSDAQLIGLVQYQPVAVAVSSVGWSGYSSGTLSCSSTATVDHAVVVVGYTASAYIIKNSWGTSWGINGYALVTRSSNTNCKITSQAHIVSNQYSLTAIMTLCIMVLCLIL